MTSIPNPTAEQVILDALDVTLAFGRAEFIAERLRAAGLLVGDPTEEQPWNDPSDVNSPTYASPWEKAGAIIETIRAAQFDLLHNRPLEDVQDEITLSINRLDSLCATMLATAGVAPQEPSEPKQCGPCRRGQHGCCDGNEYVRCDDVHDAPSPDREKLIADEIEYRVRTAVARSRLAEKHHGMTEALEAVNGEIRAGRRAASALATRPAPQISRDAPSLAENDLEKLIDAAGNEAQKCLRCGQYAVDCCGYGKWEERPLDPEKVAEVIFEETRYRNLTPQARKSLTRALCEAYKEGKLT